MTAAKVLDRPLKAKVNPLSKRAAAAPAKALRAIPEQRTPLPLPAPEVTQADVDKAIKEMQTEHLQCRSFGHSWRPLHARWFSAENHYEVEMRCGRCTTIRTRILSARGELLDNKYEYAEGYQLKGLGGLEAQDRDLIRLQSLSAILVKDLVED